MDYDAMVENFEKWPEGTFFRGQDRNYYIKHACRGGKPAGSNFADHAAHLAEVVLLGNIAIRMNQKLEWDTVNMKFPNCPEADRFVNPPYRDGFAL